MICLFKKWCQSKVKSISTADLEDLLKNQNITLLDVRTSQEYQRGHIKEARPFPLSQIDSYQGSKDKTVYLICQSGLRSKRAAGILAKKGYDVVNVRGGMSVYSGKIIGGK